MLQQPKISERNGSPESAPKTLARDLGEFAHDILTLAELQAQLFVTDARECGRRVFVPGLVLFCGLALGLSIFPLALAGLALFLIHVFEMSYVAGVLIAVAAGAILSGLLCVIGWYLVRESLCVLRRSRQELIGNLRWIKKVLERKRITRKNVNDTSWRTVK